MGFMGANEAVCAIHRKRRGHPAIPGRPMTENGTNPKSFVAQRRFGVAKSARSRNLVRWRSTVE
jgi:hypothetical protein